MKPSHNPIDVPWRPQTIANHQLTMFSQPKDPRTRRNYTLSQINNLPNLDRDEIVTKETLEQLSRNKQFRQSTQHIPFHQLSRSNLPSGPKLKTNTTTIPAHITPTIDKPRTKSHPDLYIPTNSTINHPSHNTSNLDISPSSSSSLSSYSPLVARAPLPPQISLVSKQDIVKSLWLDELYRHFPYSLIFESDVLLEKKFPNAVNFKKIQTPVYVKTTRLHIFSIQVVIYDRITIGFGSGATIASARKRAAFNAIQFSGYFDNRFNDQQDTQDVVNGSYNMSGNTNYSIYISKLFQRIITGLKSRKLRFENLKDFEEIDLRNCGTDKFFDIAYGDYDDNDDDHDKQTAGTKSSRPPRSKSRGYSSGRNSTLRRGGSKRDGHGGSRGGVESSYRPAAGKHGKS